jgi:hypothetical protein
MTRKKRTDVHEMNGTHEPQAATAESPPVVAPLPALEDDGKPKPLVSYRLNSDRNTSVSLAVWANRMTNSQTNESWEQLVVTFQRRFRNDQGEWVCGGAWRVHDLPVLLFLLQKAHAFALDRRTSDSSVPF